MKLPAVPVCDCEGILEFLCILFTDRGAKPQGGFLAEGELSRRTVR